MTHWGWYWKVKKKHLARKICSKLPRIDSFQIYKADLRTGFTVSPVDVKAEPFHDHLKITYRNKKQHSYTIPVTKLPCNYGGFRYFLHCPLCQKRMRFLYFAEHSLFLCRACLNLGYESQRLRPSQRYYYMSQGIKGLIKDKGGDLELYKKPPRMHVDTYNKLRSKEYYYENKSYQASNKELREWHGSKMDSYLDSFFDYVDETKPWRKKNPASILNK